MQRSIRTLKGRKHKGELPCPNLDPLLGTALLDADEKEEEAEEEGNGKTKCRKCYDRDLVLFWKVLFPNKLFLAKERIMESLRAKCVVLLI